MISQLASHYRINISYSNEFILFACNTQLHFHVNYHRPQSWLEMAQWCLGRVSQAHPALALAKLQTSADWLCESPPHHRWRLSILCQRLPTATALNNSTKQKRTGGAGERRYGLGMISRAKDALGSRKLIFVHVRITWRKCAWKGKCVVLCVQWGVGVLMIAC